MSADIAIREVCETGLTRATKSEMEHRRANLHHLAEEAQPASVRHIYYRAVAAGGLVEKTKAGYQKVQRQLLALRREGRMPYDWIEDNARRAHYPIVDGSPESALRYLAYTYRRDPWQDADAPRVEIWCESESIAGVLMPLKDQYAVPIFPIKGQSSETFAYEAAKIYSPGRRVVVLYAGDYDPAGLSIAVHLKGKLRRFADPSVDIDFRRLAITDEQSRALQSLGSPSKQRHWVDHEGTRHEFVGQAIEAEAVDPNVMRRLFSEAIEQIAYDHHGYDVFASNREVEVEERAQLSELARGWSV